MGENRAVVVIECAITIITQILLIHPIAAVSYLTDRTAAGTLNTIMPTHLL